jgi:hypothetical protein
MDSTLDWTRARAFAMLTAPESWRRASIGHSVVRARPQCTPAPAGGRTDRWFPHYPRAALVCAESHSPPSERTRSSCLAESEGRKFDTVTPTRRMPIAMG